MLHRFAEFLIANDSRCLDDEADRRALFDAFAREFALERELIAAVIDLPEHGLVERLRAPVYGVPVADATRLCEAIIEVRLAYKGD